MPDAVQAEFDAPQKLLDALKAFHTAWFNL
jgi:hypothetical protein